MKSLFREHIRATLETVHAMADCKSLPVQLEAAADLIADSYRNGGCLFVAGNGGSAADAQHLVAELVSRLNRDREPIRAFAMTVDTSILTAIGNDYGYEKIFSRQVEGLMQPSDAFLGITTSGNSSNIIEAFKCCRSKGVKSLLLTGRTGGLCKELCDVSVHVPSDVTAHIQEGHLVLYHTLCEMVEAQLVREGMCSYI